MDENRSTKRKKTKSKLFLLVLLIVPIAIILLTFNQSNDFPKKITYEVTGTGIASVTFEAETGTRQLSGVALPWNTTVIKNPGDFLYLSAQNGDNNECINVFIYKGEYGEEEWDKKNYSCGRFVIAEVSDRL